MKTKVVFIGGVLAMIVGGLFLFSTNKGPKIDSVEKNLLNSEKRPVFQEILKEEQENINKTINTEGQKKEDVYLNPVLQARREHELLMQKKRQEISPYLESKQRYKQAVAKWKSSMNEKLNSVPIGTPQYGEAYLKYVEEVNKLNRLEREFYRALRRGENEEAKKIASQIKAIVGVEPPMPSQKKVGQKSRNG